MMLDIIWAHFAHDVAELQPCWSCGVSESGGKHRGGSVSIGIGVGV